MSRVIHLVSATSLALALLWSATPAHALLLCAKIDKTTGGPKEGSPVKLRTECKSKKNGTPVEVAIGSTEALSAIAGLEVDVATNAASIDVLQGLHSGEACGASATLCSGQDTYDATGVCQPNDFPTGTSCGASTDCLIAGACDGLGTCIGNGPAPDGTACGPTPGQCSLSDTCSAGSCTDNGHLPAGSSCGDPGSTSCTNSDTCNASGSCLANHLPSGTPCGPLQECNGSGACVPIAP